MRRIRLGNTVFEGSNNAYLLNAQGDGPVTLIDTGIATADARRNLEAGLAEGGLGFADVEEVFLTHWHEDHAGLAGAIQAASGATVRAHAADAPLIERDPEALAVMADRQAALFDEWGMPDEPREELLAFLDRFDDARGEGAAVTPFEGGERFALGGRELEVVHLPGHAAGLVGFVLVDDASPPRPSDGDDRAGTGAELFSGDALLPRYTPNVGGADVRVERPLARYLDTLARIADRAFAVAWPGHRDPIDDPAGRAAAIVAHHRERSELVVEILAEHGPADAWTVSAELFGALEGIHILHGPGEAYAHLEHLAEADVVERTDDGYRVTKDEFDLDSTFPTVPRRT